MRRAAKAGAARKARPAAHRGSSLKEIAGVTGFSITTVSMVLNGRAAEFNISDGTRDLIVAAAKERNYQPNLHARSLRSRTTDILGLMVPTLYNRFFSEMAETFESLARSNRKLALITVTHYDRQEEIDTINYFLSQKVECVFAANPTAVEDVSELCNRAGTKHILLDSEASTRPTVTTDNFDAGLVLSRMLLASMAAARRPGRVYYVGGMAEHRITQQRLDGFRAALRERGLAYSEDQFVQTQFQEESAYRQLKALFAARKDIGGIFLNSLPPLDGLVRFFPEAPERCRQVHYGVFDYNPIMSLLVDLRVLVIKQNPEAMMKRAYEIFSGGEAAGGARLHHIPYEVVIAPAMKPFL